MTATSATPAGTATEVALSVRELAVSYGGVKAVDDVSFDVPAGAILGLIGPNGAGKTTVFDAICGFAPVERGRIALHGTDISGRNPSERARAGLGRSFQDARLFSSLTVYETLACAFERHLKRQDALSTALGLPWVRRAERRVDDRVDELIEVMGLSAFRDKFVRELSTGSRRIVDLACVIAHDPRVLLLDEPSSGIAQKETEALGPLLRNVQEQTGCTMLLIEHDMPLVTSVSDELIALETGRLIARGSPREVTNDPRVVEAYLGTDERIVARSGAVGDRPSFTAGRQGPDRGAATRPTKKAAGKRSTSKKAAAKKSTAKRSTAKKPTAKKPTSKKATAKKSAAKKTTSKRRSTSPEDDTAAKSKSSSRGRRPGSAKGASGSKEPGSKSGGTKGDDSKDVARRVPASKAAKRTTRRTTSERNERRDPDD